MLFLFAIGHQDEGMYSSAEILGSRSKECSNTYNGMGRGMHRTPQLNLGLWETSHYRVFPFAYLESTGVCIYLTKGRFFSSIGTL